MRIITVLGARPQFIKAAPLCRALSEAGVEEVLVHTGQHYDANMSEIFFKEMDIPTPKFHLGVGSGGHGKQTGEMLVKIEEILIKEKPNIVLVYGDTNSTLAGALAACKLQIPVAHVEAGLRSFNRAMPEEHNRVLTDHCSDFLFCPTQTAMDHLKNEGIRNAHLVGDTMFDAVLSHQEKISHSEIIQKFGLISKDFYLATIHRPYNTDDPKSLRMVVESLGGLGKKVVLPLHPRTKAKLSEFQIEIPSSLLLVEPQGYFEMLALQKQAKVVLTDSGGVQKEAFFLKTPCVTMRTETEWVETVQAGWNLVVGINPLEVRKGVSAFEKLTPSTQPQVFGDGCAAKKIAQILVGEN